MNNMTREDALNKIRELQEYVEHMPQDGKVVFQKREDSLLEVSFLPSGHPDNTLGDSTVVLEGYCDGENNRIYVRRSRDALRNALDYLDQHLYE